MDANNGFCHGRTDGRGNDTLQEPVGRRERPRQEDAATFVVGCVQHAQGRHGQRRDVVDRASGLFSDGDLRMRQDPFDEIQLRGHALSVRKRFWQQRSKHRCITSLSRLSASHQRLGHQRVGLVPADERGLSRNAQFSASATVGLGGNAPTGGDIVERGDDGATKLDARHGINHGPRNNLAVRWDLAEDAVAVQRGVVFRQIPSQQYEATLVSGTVSTRVV